MGQSINFYDFFEHSYSLPPMLFYDGTHSDVEYEELFFDVELNFRVTALS